MGLLPTGTGDWLAFESRGAVSLSIIPHVNAADDNFSAKSRLKSRYTRLRF